MNTSISSHDHTPPRAKSSQSGFTLIEILVVIGIIAIIATVVLIAINPARQFAQARNSQRVSNVNAILNAIGQRIADNKGVFESGCAAGAIPTSATVMKNSAGGYDIAPCLVPTYIAALPFDPSAAGAHYTSNTDYDTLYDVTRDAVTGRITVNVPAASQELGQVISITR